MLDYLERTDIALALFDLDGTLVYSDDAIGWCFNEALQEMGYAPQRIADISPLIGIPLRDMFIEFLPETAADEAVERYRRHYSSKCVERTTLLPGTMEILTFFQQRGVLLGVVTNKPLRFTRDILKALGMLDFFVLVAGPENAPKPKPDPAMLIYAMNQLGQSPARTIYVGDSLTDVRTAQAAGVRMFAVTTGAHTREELAITRPDWLGESLVALKAYLEREG